MMIVRVIFVETTRPVRIRPRIETSPVNGHFLSALFFRFHGASMREVRTNVVSVNGLWRGLESQPNILKPPLVTGGNLLSNYGS